jgi:hypothetical protein
MLQHLLATEERSFGLKDPDLAWKSLRLVSVMEWLSPSSYESLKTYLLELLSRGRQAIALEIDKIRDEVFSLRPSA